MTYHSFLTIPSTLTYGFETAIMTCLQIINLLSVMVGGGGVFIFYTLNSIGCYIYILITGGGVAPIADVCFKVAKSLAILRASA